MKVSVAVCNLLATDRSCCWRSYMVARKNPAVAAQEMTGLGLFPLVPYPGSVDKA